MKKRYTGIFYAFRASFRVFCFLIIMATTVSCEGQFARLFAQVTPTVNKSPFSTMPVYEGISAQQLQSSPAARSANIKPIQLAWFTNAPSDTTIYPILVRYFGFFVFTQGEETARKEIKSMGGKGPFLQYILFNAIRDEDPNTCFEIPYPARADSQPGDYCMIRDQHPDWFLRTSDGQLILTDYNGTLMNPASQGWRNFWLERVKTNHEKNGWDGVFLDNVEAGAGYIKKFSANRLPESFNETVYLKSIEGFLRYIYTGYFQPQGKLLFANLIDMQNPGVVFNYLRYLDGILLENFAVDWEDGYLEPAEWEKQLYVAEQTQALGKTIILVSQGREDNFKRQEFALASYLLINQGGAYFRYAHAGRSLKSPEVSAYTEAWMYKNYLLNLGQPLGNVYKQGLLWKRDFEYGHVVVDPVNHLAEFTGKTFDK